MPGSIQRWDCRINFRCTTRFVTLTGHRIAIFVVGSILGRRRGSTVAVSIDGAVGASMAIRGRSCSVVSVLLMPVELAVTIHLAVRLVLSADGQVTLHVVLGRRVGTLIFTKQSIVRIMARQ